MAGDKKGMGFETPAKAVEQLEAEIGTLTESLEGIKKRLETMNRRLMHFAFLGGEKRLCCQHNRSDYCRFWEVSKEQLDMLGVLGIDTGQGKFHPKTTDSLCASCYAFKAFAAKKEDATLTAYCMECRKKVEIRNPRQITLKNGRPAVQGVCSVCGAKVFRIGKA